MEAGDACSLFLHPDDSAELKNKTKPRGVAQRKHALVSIIVHAVMRINALFPSTDEPLIKISHRAKDASYESGSASESILVGQPIVTHLAEYH